MFEDSTIRREKQQRNVKLQNQKNMLQMTILTLLMLVLFIY
jgi:hypothetical protein